MRTTITIRTDENLRKKLLKRAETDGKPLSELVREILEAALVERSIKSRAGHLSGRLQLPRRSTELWRKRIRERNWRP
jgi:plasmid stability protein